MPESDNFYIMFWECLRMYYSDVHVSGMLDVANLWYPVALEY